MKYRLRKGKPSDLPRMMEIVRQGQISIGKLDINQWRNGYPSQDIINQDIENGNSYVLTTDADEVIAIATVIYNYEPTYDKIYDGEWLTHGDFVVVHRMAVAEEFKQQGIASILLKGIEKQAIADNIPAFKIDTHEGNIPMRKTFESNGFTYCGRIFLQDGNPRIAYEKIIKQL
ncbi:MAG: GNAT family N-acetyltransferase [Tannerella sp.]|jgi:GNAT superfamily N-acetyltransferase|nr:GNAT family N-acetyltransferase [Tannerella sp.]